MIFLTALQCANITSVTSKWDTDVAKTSQIGPS